MALVCTRLMQPYIWTRHRKIITWSKRAPFDWRWENPHHSFMIIPSVWDHLHTERSSAFFNMIRWCINDLQGRGRGIHIHGNGFKTSHIHHFILININYQYRLTHIWFLFSSLSKFESNTLWSEMRNVCVTRTTAFRLFGWNESTMNSVNCSMSENDLLFWLPIIAYPRHIGLLLRINCNDNNCIHQ